MRADAAMYRAKRAGGDRWSASEPGTMAEAGQRRDLEHDLSEAFTAGLHLDYQPIVHTGNLGWTGVEALLRWSHPHLGALTPETVLESGERAGLTLDLAGWVLRQACEDMVHWHATAELAAPALVTVNVSMTELLEPGYDDLVVRILAETHLPASQLCLEITERILLEDAEGALRILLRLNAHGIGLALDDFGTGYSSLEHLKRFPVSMVKLDRSFVSNVGRNSVDDVIVAAMTNLAHALNFIVVAEGVERSEQLDRVRQLGCENYQGFFYSGPVAANVLEGMMRKGEGGMPSPPAAPPPDALETSPVYSQ